MDDCAILTTICDSPGTYSYEGKVCLVFKERGGGVTTGMQCNPAQGWILYSKTKHTVTAYTHTYTHIVTQRTAMIYFQL